MPNTTIDVKRDMRITSFLKNEVAQEIHSAASFAVAGLLKELGKAQMAIGVKYMELDGATGHPVGGVEYGAGEGYRRRYQNGVIYLLPPSGPCWVHGSILGKYLSFGAEGGFLGYPTTDELTTPDGAGRYNHFERGSIYWTYGTGAHEVHGVIREKWAALGWEKSWLGYPTSDELPFAQDGRVSVFEHGAIYWWPDTGAIELGNVAVKYKGLYCFGETDELSPSDEPYVVFGVVPVPPGQQLEVRTQIYDDVDSGDSRPDNVELYRGIPGGMLLGVVLCEHDEGDPEKYLEQVKQGVALAGKAVNEGCVAIFGQEAGPACESIWNAVSPQIVKAVNKLLGTDDDVIGKLSWHLTAKEMVTRASASLQNFWGIQYHLESELLSDGDASYKVYLAIERV